MLKSTRLVLFAAVLAWTGAAGAKTAAAAEFVYDAKANPVLAKKLGIPVYFTVPESARASLPKTINTTDKLYEFKHPDGIKAGADVGLRLVVTKRAGMAERLAKSGIIQTGDLLLTFRSEWGGVGAYPNVQMGISHTGVAYVKDGKVHNIDNPLDQEYLGPGYTAVLNSDHYNTLKFIHIVRPRYLTDVQKKNIVGWATRLNKLARSVYPGKIAFNQDYNAPKYRSGRPLDFVQHVGRVALGQSPKEQVAMYCSEFAWSLLALRDCDPETSGDAFKGGRVPSCVRPVMRPMKATGSISYVGLADGPLTVIEAMKLPKPEREKLIHSLFVANPAGFKRMSTGHQELARDMQPKFAKLEDYYLAVANKSWLGGQGRIMSFVINQGIPENYSPTSYLINTLLPARSSSRTMDYVATLMIE